MPIRSVSERTSAPDLEARARSLAQRTQREADGRWRVDLVTITLLAMFDQQLERVGRPQTLKLEQADEELERRARALYVLLAFRYPRLFPPSYELPEAEVLRGWLGGLAGRELIEGRFLERDPGDVVSQVFSVAAPMSGKQSSFASYYSPSSVSDLMSALVEGERPWEGRFHEPCVGSGSMVTSMWWRVCGSLREEFAAGKLDRDEVTAAVEGWARGVVAIDLDLEAVWAAAAQHAVRTGHEGTFLCGNALGDPSELRPVTHPYAPPMSDAQLATFRQHLQLSVLVAGLASTPETTSDRAEPAA
jgi:hypothetical protein